MCRGVMDFSELHEWTVEYSEAVVLQRELAARVRLDCPLPDPIRTLAGVDASYEKNGDHFFASVVVLSYPDLQVLEIASASSRVTFPYIPGLLSFRELPVVLEAFRNLKTLPDVVLVDGQGIAHPRRLGLASHLGLWLGLPAIGCAKTRLCGECEEPGPRRGDRVPLWLGGEEVGRVLTTRDGISPLYISPGHLVGIEEATELVLNCCRGYRMPEPTRLAHLETNRRRAEALEIDL